MTQETFANPLDNAHTKELKLCFDPDSLEPVSQTLKGGQVWSADLARICSLFWSRYSNILDVGTHIGTYSALAASFTKGKVWSIEPSPGNFEYLAKNKNINNFKNQECFNIAASDKNGEVNFCLNGPSSHVLQEGGGEAYISVPAKPLDDILVNERVDFIKIDVEGWELNALDGLKETIKRCSPPIVFEVNGFTLQWFGYTPNDLIHKLESMGYHVFGLTNAFIPLNSFTPFPFGVMDCFALKDHHVPIIGSNITVPPNFTQILEILQNSYKRSNEDMKGYFNWYKDILNQKHNLNIQF